jgi:hypothetical protein
MAKAHGIELKPGGDHHVVSTRRRSRAPAGDRSTASPKARKWLRQNALRLVVPRIPSTAWRSR